MDTGSAHTLTQAQAKCGVVICTILMLAIYFFEHAGLDINKRGEMTEVVGTLTHCGKQRVIPAGYSESDSTDYLFIDTTGERPYLYRQPKAFREQVAAACRANLTVRLTYRTYQPLLRDWTGYSVRALHDMKRDVPIFSLEEYRAWQEKNRLYADVLMILSVAGFIYLALVWQGVIGNRDIGEVIRDIRIEDDSELIIRSSERRGASWAYLFLFGALSIWFAYRCYSDRTAILLLITVLFLFTAYAYLVEVVNRNYLSLDDEYLLTLSKPLPWLNGSVMLPVEEIERFVGRERLIFSPHGSVIQYEVSVQLVNEAEELVLFFCRDLAEAVARLGNQKLRGLSNEWGKQNEA